MKPLQFKIALLALVIATPAFATTNTLHDKTLKATPGTTDETYVWDVGTSTLKKTTFAPFLSGDCTGFPCLDGSPDGGNIIKLWAGTGTYWTALQGGVPEANRSWRLPITAPPAAGETLVMTMDQYGQMGFLPAPTTSGYVLSSTDAGVLSWAAGGSGAGDDLGSATYSDVVALWTTCTGYLKSDGTCDTPSGSATYPSAAGVAVWGGSAWGTSLTVGTGANNLVQLNASGQLPAVSGVNITDTFTDPLIAAQTTHKGALETIAAEVSNMPSISTAAAGIVQVNSSNEIVVDDDVLAASYGTTAADGARRSVIPNNTSIAPLGDGSEEIYNEGGQLKVVEGNTEYDLIHSGDVDDTPVNGETAVPVSSNWAYDHEADTTTHGTTGAIVGTTDTQTLTNKSIAALPVDGSTSKTLTAAEVSGTMVGNYGQVASDVALTLPPAADGYHALFNVGTAQSNKWGVRAGTDDKIYLLASDGTISAGSDNGYARMTAAQIGQSFACWTVKTESSAWDWQCKAISIGTSTFAAN